MKYLTDRWHFGYLVLAGILLLALVKSAESNAGEEGDPYLKWERLARDHAYVTSLSVGAPLGRLVLVRYLDTMCAIRFGAFHRGGDEKTPTKFNSGEETLFATAEEIRVANSGSTWHVLQHKTVNLVRGPIVGLGRLGFQKGQIGLHCGDAKLEWTYPNNISLGSYTDDKAKRAQLEMAPTAWNEVSQIDLSDVRLHWYHYDESRKDTVIPIEDLPPANR